MICKINCTILVESEFILQKLSLVAMADTLPFKEIWRLGFQELSSFDKALIAKQCWRLISFPHSLVSKVLKAKYYPKGNFIESKLGSNLSYIWRSILWGREVIEVASRWRIGDGKIISIYHHRWLPRPSTFKPFSPQLLPSQSWVAISIDEEGRCKEQLIRTHFLEEDATQILKTPLPKRPLENQLVWMHDKQGQFNVKIGYHVALCLKLKDWSSSSSTNTEWWKYLWNLSLPSKIKIFYWRAFSNILPTYSNMYKRKSLVAPSCLVVALLMRISIRLWWGVNKRSRCGSSRNFIHA